MIILGKAVRVVTNHRRIGCLLVLAGVAGLLSACGGGGEDVAGAPTSPVVDNPSSLKPFTSSTVMMEGGEVSLVSRNASGLPSTSDYVNFNDNGYDDYVFSSVQNDLSLNDTNGFPDVFLKKTSGQISIVSVPDLLSGGFGSVADGASGILPEFPGVTNLSQGAINVYGEHMAFVSNAKNLAGIDTNNVSDVYLRYESAYSESSGFYRDPRTYRVSISASGVEPSFPSFSPAIINEEEVAFVTKSALVAVDTNNTYDVYLKNISTGNLTLVSRQSGGVSSNGASFDPLRCYYRTELAVCFMSWGNNLVSDDTNNSLDLFLWTKSDGKIIRVSQTDKGKEANKGILGPEYSGQISFPSRLYHAEGSLVGFLSESSNIVADDVNGRLDAFAIDLYHDKIVRVSAKGKSVASGATMNGISVRSSAVAFASDQPLTGVQTSAGGLEIYVREFWPDDKIHRVSNMLTDSWPINSVFNIENMSIVGSYTVFFSGDALSLYGPPQRGVFRAVTRTTQSPY